MNDAYPLRPFRINDPGLLLNKFPQMLLHEVPSLTHIARWAGSYNSY